ncbi:MAG: permease-like cell division protein FtsX [Clostridia bacterium]|nr:permease-like cell division protein FtsX [Clostridia bacterium]
MMIRNVKYFFSQGVKGLIANSLMTLASIGIVIASLVIFGFFLLLGMNLNAVGDQVKEQCEITVFVPREMDHDAVRSVGSALSGIEFVKEARLYSKEERFQNYKESTHSAQTEVIETLEVDNPLRDAYILTLEDVEKAKEVADAAAKVEGVEEVSNRQDVINQVLSVTNTVRHVSVWLLVILAMIAVFIISNTIKLGMFARRKEINIMKFVGATNWFIRWPFIIEGMLIGAVGAAFAAMVVLVGYGSVIPGLQDFMGDIEMIKLEDVTTLVTLAFLGMGMIIGMAGSVMSIRKHLHV